MLDLREYALKNAINMQNDGKLDDVHANVDVDGNNDDAATVAVWIFI